MDYVNGLVVLVSVCISVGLSAVITSIIFYGMERRIMGDVANALAGVNVKVAKIKGEFQGEVQKLKDQLDAKGTLDADDKAALDNLNAKLDELDDLVPDSPADLPSDPPVTDPVTTPDTTGEVVSPVTEDVAEHIESGEPIPDPTGDVEDTDVSAEDVAEDSKDQ